MSILLAFIRIAFTINKKTRSRLGSENKESNEKKNIQKKTMTRPKVQRRKNQTPYDEKCHLVWDIFSISMTKGFEGLHI